MQELDVKIRPPFKTHMFILCLIMMAWLASIRRNYSPIFSESPGLICFLAHGPLAWPQQLPAIHRVSLSVDQCLCRGPAEVSPEARAPHTCELERRTIVWYKSSGFPGCCWQSQVAQSRIAGRKKGSSSWVNFDQRETEKASTRWIHAGILPPVRRHHGPGRLCACRPLFIITQRRMHWPLPGLHPCLTCLFLEISDSKHRTERYVGPRKRLMSCEKAVGVMNQRPHYIEVMAK